VPEVLSPTDLKSWCKSAVGLKLIADPDATSVKIPESTEQKYSLLIGPEGGFAPAEIAQTSAAEFTGVYLGSRILRAETAAISMLALVNQTFSS
jgi:16S rRNA (uracil1498-N3)-methyltransferase